MKALIIGDSIIRYLMEYLPSDLLGYDLDLKYFKGTTIPRLTMAITDIDLSNYEFIFLHVGTNDVFKDETHCIQEFKILLQEIFKWNPNVKIIVSAVIPWGDNFYSPAEDVVARTRINDRIDGYNKLLSELCSTNANLFFCSSNASWQGYIGRDGQHLNRRGNWRLAQQFVDFFASEVANQ